MEQRIEELKSYILKLYEDYKLYQDKNIHHEIVGALNALGIIAGHDYMIYRGKVVETEYQRRK